MIKLIIFDAGDILYDWQGWFEYFGKKASAFLKNHNAKIVDENNELWNDLGKLASVGKISLHEAHKRYLARLGVSEKFVDEYEKIDKEGLKHLKLKENSIPETLTKLKENGLRVAVLSDTPHMIDTKKFMLSHVGLENFFDGIFISSEIGHQKPDREAYETVLKYFNVKPTETIFVGHDEDELAGAKVIGLKTVSYRGHSSADFVIKKFSELLGVVESLG